MVPCYNLWQAANVMKITVETALQRAHDKARFLWFAADAAMLGSEEPPGEHVWSGLSDACEEIAELVERVQEALDAATLGQELTRRNRER
jgi:hypothetical protein